jgi:hypothetical protein
MTPTDTTRPPIRMLWVEGRLSRLERLSMASFLACGHPVELYTYGLDNDPPKGVAVLDAAAIVPAARRFTCQGNVGYGSQATFSNLFRFTLLYELGGIWCDTDMVCLKPLLFAAERPMFFASELARENREGRLQDFAKITSGALKVPAKHPLMERCLEKFARIDLATMEWGEAGPGIVRSAVEELGLAEYVLHPEVFCSVPHWETPSLLFGARAISPNAFAIHFWNEILRWNFFDKDAPYDRHSIYERLARHYLPDEYTA